MPVDVLDQLGMHRVVPVVEIEDAAAGPPLARALADAGLPVMEVTLRTPAALEAIRRIAAELPDFLLGAGTLLTTEQLTAATEAGARFGVSPGFSPALSAAAFDRSLPYVPGAVTPTEILAAAAAGHRRIKFFPAEQSGGVSAIKSLSPPFAALGIRFMPTGGIRPETCAAYLELPGVFAVGGTWVASRRAVAAGAYAEISEAARRAVALAADKPEADE